MSSGFENVKETHEKVISCFYLKKAFFFIACEGHHTLSNTRDSSLLAVTFGVGIF